MIASMDYFPRVWLRLLQDSFICNLSAGLRPGGFLNPYTSPWGPYLKFFTRANAPYWLLWGHSLSSYGPSPANKFMRENFFPPIESIDLAKQHYKQYSQLVVPEGDPLDVRGVRNSAPARNNEFFFTNLDTMPLPTHHGDAEVGLGIEDFHVETADAFVTNTDPDHPPPPPVSPDRLACVHANSGQKPGESWDSFYVRYMDGLERCKARETAQEKANRLHLEQLNKNGPVGRKKAHAGGGLARSIRGFTGRRRISGTSASIFQSIPLGVEVPYVQPYQDLFETDADLPDFISKENPTQLVSKEDKATSSMLQAVQDLVVRVREPVEDPTMFPSGPIAEYLALRHGFEISATNNWNHTLHGVGKLPAGRADLVVKNLMCVDDKQSIQAEATTAIVNFYNVMAASTPLDKLPPAWDVVSRLKLDFERLRLQCLPSALLEKKTTYVLRPPEGSDDQSEWFVALHSATAVLLVYRSGWTTMEEIAKGLLSYRIPFRTVVECRSRHLVKVPAGKTRGLGQRRLHFSPTVEDMYDYEDAREEVLQSPCGRAILMQGGIAARLAYGVVPEYLVYDGPNLVHTEVVCTDGELDFIDDAVTTDQLDVVSGVFLVDTDGTAGAARMEAHKSFWPKQSTWFTTGYAGDQWLPPAEQWFIPRLRSLIQGNDFELLNATEWKSHLTRNVKKSRPVFANSDNVAAEFIRRQLG
ncbi:hypothetical protein GALMADRAFT_149128 [Galerina marginata CBS 339.88]|uniref:Uncharacterized protein n=1 Tax=Galerina marginata (strain CBS 339.88) TaxID=685588 RepID=A0A067S2D6_GALM3|nr:hypothetical protein GALMADRAFT_149128 [Galerina marginata CBS 339.88]